MRQTLMLAAMAVMTACGANGNTPWDQNDDGLITACEGLNSYASDSTPGCEPAPNRCAVALREDGTSAPCVGEEICVPSSPPVFSCSNLPLALCMVSTRCEVVQVQQCGGFGGSTDTDGAPASAEDPATGFREPTDPSEPPQPRCGVGCSSVQLCAERAPVTCESLSTDVCLSHPGCAIEGSASGESGADIACAPTPDGETGGFVSPCYRVAPQRCVTLPAPDVCGSRDPNVCSIDGRCVLELGPVCDAICAPDGTCPPCAIPSSVCVPAPPPDYCAGRDLNSCEVDGRCMVQAWACPAICKPDGVGGCLPCDAPPTACVPVPVPTPVPGTCAGLDRVSCQAAGCEVIDLACTLECRDDGHGGCLPCESFSCGEAARDGGSAPPSP